MPKDLSRLFLSSMPADPSVGQKMNETEAIRLAICQAFEGYGFTSPNPAVGCVLLDKDDRFLSMGSHHRAGLPHAEIEALAAVAGSNPVGHPNVLPRDSSGWDPSGLPLERLKGAKAFVTLEPCAHEGKTPSCAKTFAKLPFSEVTAVLRDPFPQVAGQGFEILKEAGFRVRCLEEEGNSPEVIAARAACEMFLVNIESKRPFVSLKVATSLDGMMALQNGESQWITGEGARTFARYLRGAHDACLVGRQTVLQDDPKLDARETPFANSGRKLVILDSKGEVFSKPDLQIFKVHRPENLFVCVGPETKISPNGLAQILPWRAGQPVLAQVLRGLWDREVRSVWIEGGAATLSSALQAGFGDRLWLFQGPHLLGGQFGRSWTESWGAAQMSGRTSLSEIQHLSFGQDQLTTGRLSNLKS